MRFTVFLLATLIFVFIDTRVSSIDYEEALRFVEKINKPALLTIESPDGDLIDCVDKMKQPAFDHPLLKDHKIREIPKTWRKTEKVKSASTLKNAHQIWLKNGTTCPTGTVPIRRTTVKEVMRASYGHEYGKKQASFNHRELVSINHTTHERKMAVVIYAPKDKPIYRASATLNMWSPTVEWPSETSNSQMWVLTGTEESLNTIEVGWHVCPWLYGRPATRLFIYWTRDGYKSSGCYNLLCDGFVMGESKWVLGGEITPTSELGGEQFDIDVLVKQDGDKNWWLKVGNEWVGYWPHRILNGLVDGASAVQWGGEIHSMKRTGQHTSTEMGSGQFASEGHRKACYITQLVAEHTTNDEDKDLVKVRLQDLVEYVTDPNCYSLSAREDHNNDNLLWLFHGGPGLSDKCHI